LPIHFAAAEYIATHVHDKNVVLVEALNDVLGRHTDGTDKELGALLDDNVDELIKLALGVVVVGLASAAADLGDEEVDTEGLGRSVPHTGNNEPTGRHSQATGRQCQLTEVGRLEVLLEVLDDTAEVLGADIVSVYFR
jgi:hypothetical protein